MLTKETAIIQAKEFIEACRQKDILFDKVFLFGSAAKNSATDNSDIDLLLVSENFGNDKWENAKLLAPINKYFYNIDAHPFSPAYFLHGDPFINEIKKTGIEIY